MWLFRYNDRIWRLGYMGKNGLGCGRCLCNLASPLVPSRRAGRHSRLGSGIFSRRRSFHPAERDATRCSARFSRRFIPPLARRDSAPLGHRRRFAVEFLAEPVAAPVAAPQVVIVAAPTAAGPANNNAVAVVVKNPH